MRRNIYSALGTQWISAAMAIVSSVLVARMMQPEELGVFGVTMAMSAILGTFQLAGTSEYLVYSSSVDHDLRRSVYGLTILQTAAVCMILLLGRPLWTWMYHNEGVADVAAVMALQMALYTPIEPINSMLNREERFDLISIAMVARNGSLSILQVLFVWFGWSYMGLAYAELGSGIISGIVFLMIGGQYFLLRPSFRGIGRIVGFSGKLLGANLLNIINNSLPPILIGALGSLAQSALFGRANMISRIYAQTVARAVDPLLNARIAADNRQGVGPTRTLIISSRMMLTLSVAFFGFVAVAADLIVPLVFGEQWAAAAPAMRVLSFGFMLWPLTSPTSAILLAASRPGLLMRIRAVNMVVRAAAVVLLAPWGLTAIAAGLAVSAYVNFAQSLLAARRVAQLDIPSYLLGLRRSLLTALIPLGVTTAALFALNRAGVSGWLLLVSIGLVMALGQVAALVLLKHPLWDEARHIGGKLRLRRA